MIKRLRDFDPPFPAAREKAEAIDGGNELHFEVPFSHRLRFTQDIFGSDDHILIDLLRSESHRPARLLFFLDEQVAEAQPRLKQRIHGLIDQHSHQVELAGAIQLVPGGEQCKNDRSILDAILAHIHDARIDRMSYVIVIGGGAVLDCVGFAAGIAHRGVRLVRMPTTTLSQDDSGVGVKNGVNSFGKKNYLGCFAVPWAVINDRTLLQTLPQRSWLAGFAEAVKVALLKDAELFEKIAANASQIVARQPLAQEVIRRSAELHADHITRGGDPFELTTARPLDFGHWSAHKLEQLTSFALQHGEAVAIGLALDVTYAARMDLLAHDDAVRIKRTLVDLGLPIFHPALLDATALHDGLEEFREHLGGMLTITLIRAPGQPLNVHHIDWPTMLAAVDELKADHQD